MKKTINSRSIVVLTITALVLLSAATAVPVAASANPKPVPHSFHGEVQINGDPAPAGMQIVAQIDGEDRGEAVTDEEGIYGGPGVGDEKLMVEGETGDDGAVITFLVDGEEANETATYQEGTNTELNLTVNGDGGGNEEHVSVTTGEATGVDESSATLTGELTELEGADDATVHFEYGSDGNLTNETAPETVSAGDSFDAELTDLEADTEYTFKAVAETDGASAVGEEVTFTTDSDNWDDENITVTTDDAINVSESSATLTGNLTELVEADNATAHFEYGPDGDFTNETPEQSVEEGDSFDHEVTGLEADTDYSFRAIVETDDGAAAGGEETFTTEGDDGGNGGIPSLPPDDDDEDEDESDADDENDEDESDADESDEDESDEDESDADDENDEDEAGMDEEDDGDDEETDDADEDNRDDADDDDDSVPGFGVVGALVGLLSAAALASRQS